MPKKVKVLQSKSARKRDVIIPPLAWWLVSIGAFIAGIFGSFNAYLNTPNADVIFWLTALIGFIMGIIPVCLATFLEKKHCTVIYWLTFFSVWMPAGIFVWFITVIWAIFDKKRA